MIFKRPRQSIVISRTVPQQTLSKKLFFNSFCTFLKIVWDSFQMFLNLTAFKSRQILTLFIGIEIKYIYRPNFVFKNKRSFTRKKIEF